MKVMIAIDQSMYAEQILDAVKKRRWPVDSKFKIVTVVPPFEWEGIMLPAWQASADDIRKARKMQGLQKLRQARKSLLASMADQQVFTEYREGSPREQIIYAAATWMPDLIVIGAHGNKPNRLLGSWPRTLSTHTEANIHLVRLRDDFSADDKKTGCAPAYAAV